MLRRATEDETAAFLLVERTMQRTRPQVNARGLESFAVPEGRIERGSLGRLRFRFNGDDSDYEPENGRKTRTISDEEAAWWTHIRRMVAMARPIADSQWNLVSMHIGSRVLRRLPLGSVMTIDPDGSPPFKGSRRLSGTEGRPKPDTALRPALRREADLLAAIDAFLREGDDLLHPEPRTVVPWNLAKAARRPRYHGASSPLIRGRSRTKGKWHKCPICRAPMVLGRFNTRIPFGIVRAGSGSIRDLRGGYMSRLRETYLVEDPVSLVRFPHSKEETAEDLSTEPVGQS